MFDSQTGSSLVQAGSDPSWSALAMFVVGIVSAVFAGIMGGVVIYFTVSFGTRRETRREIGRMREDLRAELAKISEVGRRADRSALLSSQESVLRIVRKLLLASDLPQPEGESALERGGRETAEAAATLEHEIRRLHVLRREAQRSTFWWLAEYGDARDLPLIEEYIADETEDDSELLSQAREAIRRIQGR
jgi:hypothetical protein